jgi:hypothetical protein
VAFGQELPGGFGDHSWHSLAVVGQADERGDREVTAMR